MTSTFADTFYFLALLNPRDQAHNRAIVAIAQRRGRLVTSEFVLLEVADAYADPADRPEFLTLVDSLASDPAVTIEPASSTLYQAALELYRRRPDKDWSLTDCTSFIVMQREGIIDALTGDRHFEQAGFVALLK